MAILMSTGAAAKRSTVYRELQAALACISVNDGIEYPASWACEDDRGRVSAHLKPNVPIRVQALQLAVMRVTNLPSDDTTLPAAVRRIHESMIEIRA